MLNNYKIFLTGGTGFFGKSILSMKLRGYLSNCQLTILSRNPQLFINQNSELALQNGISFIEGDIVNFKFPNIDFDFIVHGATPSTKQTDEEYRNIIINGTKRILQFSNYQNIKRILFISSGAVYGKQPYNIDKIPQNFTCNPITEYGKSKYYAQQLCLNSKIDCVIARCFAFVGPYLNFNIHFAIGNFIRDCLNQKDIEINGDGTPYRSYLYSDDLVDWLFEILFNGGSREIYNVGSDKAITIYELAKTVQKVLNVKNNIIVKEKVKKDIQPQRYIPCIDKICKELGVSVKTNLESAILKSINKGVLYE